MASSFRTRAGPSGSWRDSPCRSAVSYFGSSYRWCRHWQAVKPLGGFRQIPFRLSCVGAHIRNSDARQQPKDSFMDLLQRIANDALVGVDAIPVFGETGGQEDRAVDGPDHVQRGYFARLTCQFVAAVGALFRAQKAVFDQFLQDF